MPLVWHVDGKQVKLNDDYEATITASGGYEQLTATVDRDEVAHAHQGSTITGRTHGGFEAWSGTLDATPAISRHPVLRLTATGPVARLRRQRANRLYQSRDYSLWKPITSDPHNYTSIGGNGVTDIPNTDGQQGRLQFRQDDATGAKQNDTNGFCFWAMGEDISRIAFDWTSKASNPSYVLRIFSGAGPSGTLTQRGADIALTATSGSVDRAITADDDLIAILIVRTGADATTTTSSWWRVGNLRVNGRTDGDDFSPGQIIADIAQAVGLKTNDVESSGQNALPFYWEGGSWADAIAELAGMDDWAWMVYRNNVEYSPWDTKWNLRFGQEAEDLDFPPIYNSVRVFYTTLAGAPRSVRLQAKPDPLARFDEDNEYPYDLSGSYDSDKVPTDVAASLLERVSAQQVVGSVTVDRLDTDKRVWTPRRHYTVGNTERIYHIRPGDLAKLEPYPTLPPQRIVGVRLRANDVQVEFGSEVSATRLLARIDRMRARQRRKP